MPLQNLRQGFPGYHPLNLKIRHGEERLLSGIDCNNFVIYELHGPQREVVINWTDPFVTDQWKPFLWLSDNILVFLPSSFFAGKSFKHRLVSHSSLETGYLGSESKCYTISGPLAFLPSSHCNDFSDFTVCM